MSLYLTLGKHISPDYSLQAAKPFLDKFYLAVFLQSCKTKTAQLTVQLQRCHWTKQSHTQVLSRWSSTYDSMYPFFIHDRYHGYRTWRGSFFLVVGSCVSSSCAGTTTALVLKLIAVAFSGARFPLPTLCLFVWKSFALALFAGFPRFIWASIEQAL